MNRLITEHSGPGWGPCQGKGKWGMTGGRDSEPGKLEPVSEDMGLSKSWQGLSSHAEHLGLCPKNREEPLRGFVKKDMTRIASCKDDPGCSCKL